MNDGGPAFPGRGLRTNPITGEQDVEILEGMTLRDYFAGQALIGINALEVYDQKDSAKFAYLFADAMLKERAK